MLSNHLILCHPLLLPPSIIPSIRVFSNESALCIRWPKDWSFSFSISPSNEYSGLNRFRIDWFNLLVAQRTLKSLLQHHSSKASILWRSAFFMVQLSLLLLSSCRVTSDSLHPHGLQQSRLLCSSSSPEACPSSCPLHRWCHPAISSSDALFSFCPQYFPVSGTFPMSQLFSSDDQILEFQLQHQSFQWALRGDFPSDGLVWSPCCPRDLQEFSPAPQFKGINSSALCLLHDPVLTSVHDYWEDHSLDYLDLFWQSNVSAFLYTV